MADIATLEKFVLAEDPSAELAKLVEGSNDHFYFSVLHKLKTGAKANDVDATLEAWRQKGGAGDSRFQQLEARAALARYDEGGKKNEAKACKFFTDRFGLWFEHQPQHARASAPPSTHPSVLDQELVDSKALLTKALRENPQLNTLTDTGLERAAKLSLDDQQRRRLLQRLQRPDLPNLVDLVDQDLRAHPNTQFGGFGIHRQLTIDQLDKLLALQPALRNQTQLVNAYINKLAVRGDANPDIHLTEFRDYLNRLHEFADTLPPAFNSIKASVLLQKLTFQSQRAGVYDEALFIEYLKLPKATPTARREFYSKPENQKYQAHLGQGGSLPMLAPIHEDTELVNSFLAAFFSQTTRKDFKVFETYLDSVYLQRQFAQAQLTSGLGKAAAHQEVLGERASEDLRTKVEIELRKQNSNFYHPSAPVYLTVDIKNVDKLTIKVFEINTLNYHRDKLEEVPMDINLDGLIPNQELNFEYNTPPVIRHRETFEFPGLHSKRGVFAIDFIGGGISSRAMIFKGALSAVSRPSVAGQMFRVLNEDNQVVKGASLWLNNQEFESDEDSGEICLPYTQSMSSKVGVLAVDNVSSLLRFQHQPEVFEFRLGAFLDRETMLRDNLKGKALLRPVLLLHGTAVSTEILENVSLVVELVDQQGVSTTKRDNNIKLTDDGELEVTFQVTDQVRTANFTLAGSISVLSRPGSPQEVQASTSFDFNQLDGTELIEDAHLKSTSEGYRVLILGKTGEPKPNKVVVIELRHAFTNDTIRAELQTDDTGSMFLGPLPFIVTVTARLPHVSRSWSLDEERHTYPSNIHVASGEVVRVPIMDASKQLSTLRASLIEVVFGEYLRTKSDSLQLSADGYITIADLTPGEYSLAIKELTNTFFINIRVSPQSQTEEISADVRGLQLAFNPYKERGTALWQCDRCQCQGLDEVFHNAETEFDLCRICYAAALCPNPASRVLQLSARVAPQISSAAVEGSQLKIKLANVTSQTRLHVLRSNFVSDDLQPYNRLREPFPAVEPEILSAQPAISFYESGRRLGDEYRYVLERRQQKPQPGNMLERPTLILTPVELRETVTQVQAADAGACYERRMQDERAYPSRAAASRSRRLDQQSLSPNLDFLSQASTLLCNIRPTGTEVSISLDDLNAAVGGCVSVVLVDDQDVAVRVVPLDSAKSPLQTRSIVLASPLDPQTPFAETREVTLLTKPSDSWKSSQGSSTKSIISSVEQMFEVLHTLAPTLALDKFKFVAKWQSLPEAEKRKKYSEFACAELNFFLSRKDPAFFAQVVKPFLANRVQKSFMDKWLLGEPLDEYALPAKFEALNTLEQLLVAVYCRQAGTNTVPLSGMVAKLKDYVQHNPADTERLNFAFDTALKGFASEEPPPPPAPGGGGPPMEAMYDMMENAMEEDEDAFGGMAADFAPMAAMAMAPAPMAMAMSMDVHSRQMPAFAQKSADISKRKMKKAKQLVKPGEKAKQIGERNYWEVVSGSTGHLVQPSAFWLDYARFLAQPQPVYNTSQAFLSGSCLQATRSLAEVLFALAVLDLPFENAVQVAKDAHESITVSASHPAYVFSKQIRLAENAQTESILLHEHFFDPTDAYTQNESGDSVDKFVTSEFLTFKVYGCRIVITNTTSTPLKLSLLRQIPAGALPVLSGFFTSSAFLFLQPYSTVTQEYFFYFPQSGDYVHYPAHASQNGTLCGHAHPFTLHVVSELATIDTTSWSLVANDGAPEQVLDFLRTENLLRINIEEIAWRLRDASFYVKAIEVLRQRCYYNALLWSFSVLHNDTPSLREYLSDRSQMFGPGVDSTLVKTPADQTYVHTEFVPVINARAHRFAHARAMPNQAIENAYRELLQCAVATSKPAPSLHLAIVYHLLLQDRINEAKQFLARTPAPAAGAADATYLLQRDYLSAYLDFFTGDKALPVARAVAQKYKAQPTGVARWDKLFGEISDQLQELDSGVAVDAATRAGETSSINQPSLSFDVKNDIITVAYDSLRNQTCTIRFFAMDIELLFSNNPFVQKNTKQFSYIQPNFAVDAALPAQTNKVDIPMPAQYKNANVFVEITASGLRRSSPVFSSALECQVSDTHGHLRVLNGEGEAVPAAYVKVFYRDLSGKEEFYKDGYTDLRGRFDYVTLNTREQLDNATAFALLVVSERHGSVVLECNKPTL